MAFLDDKGLERVWQHTIARLNSKVEAEEGKGLSTEDYTTEDKEKVASIDNLKELVGDKSVAEQIADATSGSGEGSTALGGGEASGEASLANGVDNLDTINQDLGLGLTETPITEASGAGSTALGVGAQALNMGSLASGYNTVAGCLGFRWWDIDVANKKIHLSTNQRVVPQLNEDGSFKTTEDWEDASVGTVVDNRLRCLLTNQSGYIYGTTQNGLKLEGEFHDDMGDTMFIDWIIYNSSDEELYRDSYSKELVDQITGENIQPIAILLLSNLPTDLNIESITITNIIDLTASAYVSKIDSIENTHEWLDPATNEAPTLTWTVGDELSLYRNGGWHILESTITEVGNDGMPYIVVDQLGFTQEEVNSAGEVAQDWSWYAISVPTKPKSGVVQLAHFSSAFGYESYAGGEMAFASGSNTIAAGNYSHTEGTDTRAGYAGHAEGWGTRALGRAAHAEGKDTTASNSQSHAEGRNTVSSGGASHAEGASSIASGHYAHAEGNGSKALGQSAHAEGHYTQATTTNTHAEGNSTQAIAYNAHAEGKGSVAAGYQSHAEGENTTTGSKTNPGTYGTGAHAEGKNTIALSNYSHAEGFYSATTGDYAHAEGGSADQDSSTNNLAAGEGSHVEGAFTESKGIAAHAEGWLTTATGNYSHTEGNETTANFVGSHMEGYNTTDKASYNPKTVTLKSGTDANNNQIYTTANGTAVTNTTAKYAHAEGQGSKALHDANHAEGYATIAAGKYSHTEGQYTQAEGQGSHAEGRDSVALGHYSHVEGRYNIAGGINAHAEGNNTYAKGNQSHTEGTHTVAASDNQHAEGKYNLVDANNTYAHIVGNGTASKRSNAHTVDWNGNGWFAGNVTVGTDNKELATKEYVDDAISGVESGEANSPIKFGETNDSGVLSATVDEYGDAITESYAAKPGSMAVGYENKALAHSSIALGRETIAGVKGYYCHSYNSATKTIQLSEKKESKYWIGFLNTAWVKGDKVCILESAETANHILTASIASIDNSTGILVLDKALDFEVKRTTPITGTLESAIYVPTKPQSGVVPFGKNSLALGLSTIAAGENSIAAGRKTLAAGAYSFATGRETTAGYGAVAEGYGTKAIGHYSHAEGNESKAYGNGSHAEGYNTIASSKYGHAEGESSQAIGFRAHAEGYNTTAYGSNSHSEGQNSYASGGESHAEGVGGFTETDARGAHAEGYNTNAYGLASHAEGHDTYAHGYYSHAEGEQCIATGDRAHAEGYDCLAEGTNSHAQGDHTEALGTNSHTQGLRTVATGTNSAAMGRDTIASGVNQIVMGKYNVADDASQYALIIGNGQADDNDGNSRRANAMSVDWKGNITYSAGTLSGFMYLEIDGVEYKVPLLQ